MILSEVKENDEILEIGGITFVVDKKFMRVVTPIKVDYKIKITGRGFVITYGENA
ncbi:hypothetical protein [Desulfitobacterium chlororespirans]|uniref:Uncharacterized protein n=1 Tax=Desulfitobacterium chlororespirans DSM 11544 TaxID=1121395 RepID=A0A1M7UGB7_9FIRM|nr:hypothetical protein [Desulfitobacterium chlororespirans]SHN81945.1 hypothetical protein SAMN02745215_03698 [Desulfitobacterium chlororespirans DSM 11544]